MLHRFDSVFQSDLYNVHSGQTLFLRKHPSATSLCLHAKGLMRKGLVHARGKMPDGTPPLCNESLRGTLVDGVRSKS